MDSLLQTAENNADYAIVSDIGGGYFTGGWRNRRDEYYAGFRNRADAWDRYPYGGGRAFQRRYATILIEAVLVCLIGGALGISLSFAIGLIVEMFLPNWRIAFPYGIVQCILCSTVIGVVFGCYLPAVPHGLTRLTR